MQGGCTVQLIDMPSYDCCEWPAGIGLHYCLGNMIHLLAFYSAGRIYDQSACLDQQEQVTSSTVQLQLDPVWRHSSKANNQQYRWQLCYTVLHRPCRWRCEAVGNAW